MPLTPVPGNVSLPLSLKINRWAGIQILTASTVGILAAAVLLPTPDPPARSGSDLAVVVGIIVGIAVAALFDFIQRLTHRDEYRQGSALLSRDAGGVISGTPVWIAALIILALVVLAWLVLL